VFNGRYKLGSEFLSFEREKVLFHFRLPGGHTDRTFVQDRPRLVCPNVSWNVLDRPESCPYFQGESEIVLRNKYRFSAETDVFREVVQVLGNLYRETIIQFF
jgi:hypothetical protein